MDDIGRQRFSVYRADGLKPEIPVKTAGRKVVFIDV